MSLLKLSRWTKRRRTDKEVNRLLTELQETESHSNYIVEAVPSKEGITTERQSFEVPDAHEPVSCNPSASDIYLPELADRLESDEPNDDFSSSHHNSFTSDCSTNSSVDCDSLTDELGEWAIQHNITHAALGSLLKLLHKSHPELPRDSRTLLNRGVTSSALAIQNIAGGSYYHFGIEKGVIQIIADLALGNGSPLKLHVNIDGLPLHRSTSAQFWPILGLLANCSLKEPFVIGLFYGMHKPKDVNAFFNDFVNEFKKLQTTGVIYGNKKYDIVLAAVICDTPARAYVKSVKGHTGYFGCDKCTQEGVFTERRMTFPEINASLRTDESFRAMSDEDHHLGQSPLMSLSVGMVSNFPLDYMHLICLGVTRKLMYLWIRGPLATRLGAQTIRELSEALVQLKVQVPREFARKPRSLNELDRWKATELRQFLLYTGPVCLQRFLNEAMFKNFMLLSSAMYILLSPNFCQDYCDFAGDLRRIRLSEVQSSSGQTPSLPLSARRNQPNLCRSSVPTGNSLTNDGCLSTIFQLLVQLKDDVQELKAQNTILLQHASAERGEEYDLTLPDGLQLPVNTDEELATLEAALTDSNLRKRMVIHLSLLGGKSLSDVVGRLLRHLMTVALQRQYNWFGHKGKKEFGKLNLAGVVCRAVRKNTRFARITDSEVRLKCAAFFTNSRDRKEKTSRSAVENTFCDESMCDSD